MAKLTTADLVNLENETSTVATINANNTLIETAIENTLSRDGTTPNTMAASLDMNSNRILNLPAPAGDTEPVRLGDLGNLVDGDIVIETSLDYADYSTVAPATGDFVPFFDITDSNIAHKATVTTVVETVTAPHFTTIELGGVGVSDTTLSRSSAGVMAVEGVTVPLNSITNTHTALAIELGHASDTTITRSSAGVIAVEAVTVPLNSITNAHTALTIDLGHASDTTVGRFAAGVLSLEGAAIYPGIPINSQSAAYGILLADANTCIYHPSTDNNARTFTLPANGTIALPVGTIITFVNEVNTVTIAITTDTLTFLGTGLTGSRTLAASGMATAYKVASTKWVISGVGLS